MPMGVDPNFKRLIWYVFASTKGGPTRILIIELLKKRPYNINQLSKKLGMDYKTVLHHIKVLEENRMIIPNGKEYGTIYFPSQYLEESSGIFKEIKEKLEKERIKKRS